MIASSDTFVGMTTDENFMIAHRVALLIEDQADNDTDGRDPRRLATDYVENVLDNGWISDMDDVPVWELVAALGHDRNDMDSLAVFAQIAALIAETTTLYG